MRIPRGGGPGDPPGLAWAHGLVVGLWASHSGFQDGHPCGYLNTSIRWSPMPRTPPRLDLAVLEPGCSLCALSPVRTDMAVWEATVGEP
jgi:hypothetical protein